MRRIKSFGGQHQTLPIKDEKVLKNFMYRLKIKYENARTPVKKYQADRNYMMCLVGFNTAFRAEDLLQLRVCDLNKGYVHITENKTGKVQNFKMNRKLKEEILAYIKRNNLCEYDYMFLGQKKYQDGKEYHYPITRQRAYRIISKTAKEVGIGFTFGIHSLRKTFGYMYIKNGGKPETLMKMYNHDDYNVTMLYVCWGKDDAEHDRASIFLG